jgi:hypothetical protein
MEDNWHKKYVQWQLAADTIPCVSSSPVKGPGLILNPIRCLGDRFLHPSYKGYFVPWDHAPKEVIIFLCVSHEKSELEIVDCTVLHCMDKEGGYKVEFFWTWKEGVSDTIPPRRINGDPSINPFWRNSIDIIVLPFLVLPMLEDKERWSWNELMDLGG